MQKKSQKNHLICVNMKKKTVKEVKMHKFSVSTCKSLDFARSQKKIARSHDGETVTFRNSGLKEQCLKVLKKGKIRKGLLLN